MAQQVRFTAEQLYQISDELKKDSEQIQKLYNKVLSDIKMTEIPFTGRNEYYEYLLSFFNHSYVEKFSMILSNYAESIKKVAPLYDDMPGLDPCRNAENWE